MTQSNNIVDLLEAGIKAEGLRQRTIASNMANIQTPGYRRIDVKFDELLAKALESSRAVDLDRVEPEIYEPRNTTIRNNGNDVSMEAELGSLVKNSLRHTAYVRLMQKKFTQIEAAIRVGG
ncbi:MAG: flagellar basal body rod protein FlgB [Sedimentisphaerales bacterium]|jgi:flagellar basal-body rod protein FlgB|nr:flagellar basal body rod protein FlgB [Sedimentisphaerales bacterium]HNY79276.1 flagellar basal body rod protein FlgB [Sedimentisphaerales bacterium]HOC64526.1 flagellar basal body rod protein FlgB [Sedimentisphaerales bacterium]HOH63389.1 flagellar basal body rod protein FlgB [Sedimentisphaerales bacterium]HPY48831.1 flagellar basal body rod protein FlgB [Sedimentisphaerales bacterium]